jgi:bacillaene biosynthesis, polyketide synthase / nonribosomal peptide synthetase PksJ/BaeJ
MSQHDHFAAVDAQHVPREGVLAFARLRAENGSQVFSAVLSPAEHWLVGEHRVQGIPTLVGTAYLELARAGFVRCTDHSGTVELRDVVFLVPLMIPDGEQREIGIVLEPMGACFKFLIRSRSGGEGWVDHAIGIIGASSDEDSNEYYDMQALLQSFRIDPHQGTSRVPSEYNNPHIVQVGPRWQCTMSVAQETNEGLAILRLPAQYVNDLTEFSLHPAMLDCATSFALSWAAKGGVYLPYSYDAVKIKGPMTQELYCYARYTPASTPEDELLTAEVDVFNPQGRLLVEVRGYSLKRIRERP